MNRCEKYRRLVDPVPVRDHAVGIVAPLVSPGAIWNAPQAAALFDWVRDNVRYVADPLGIDYPARPEVTLATRGGDCEDYAILLVSLLAAVSIPARLVYCSGGKGDHVLAEVFFAKHRPDVIISWLTACYAGKVATPSGFWWDGDAEGNAWVVADAAACRYLGDFDWLAENDYVRRSGGSWRWAHPVDFA